MIVSAAALVLFALDRDFASQAIAAFALLFSLPALYKRMAPTARERFGRLRPNVREWITAYYPYVVVVVGTLIALGPVSLGQMPVSQDHANHYFATHILVREMISSGRFFGWTDSIGTGYPFGDTYHTPVYLVTGFLYLVSFALISLKVSYAFGIVIVWVVPVIAVTAWTRRIAGPIGAMFAGLAFALDMGSDREGGWIYSMFHGVWPQHFGAGIWVLALLALFRLTEKPTSRRFCVAALTAGFALWMHPMNSIALLLGGVLLFAVQYLFSQKEATTDDRQRSLLLIPALIVGGLIGLVWVIRMMAAGDVVFADAAYWKPLSQIMSDLLKGELMENQLAVVSVLGLLGLIQIAVQGGRFRVFTLLLPAVCILIGSMALLLESDIGLAGGGLGLMQYRRFSVSAKPFWFAMSGVGVSFVGQALKSALEKRVPVRLQGRILLFAVLAPFLVAAVSAVPGLFRSPTAYAMTLERTGDARNLAKLKSALEAEAKRCPDGECRAVYYEKPGHGGLYPVIFMADLGFAWQTTLTLPANNFEWINETTDVDVMAERGVSVVISKWPLKHKRLKEIGVFGKHRLYRLEGAEPIRAVVEGGGKAEINSWEPERRVIHLTGTNRGSKLLVIQPPYRKWHAEQAGRALSISRITKNKQVVSSIEGIGDGDLVLYYDDSVIENVITVLGSILLLLSAVGVIMRPRPIPLILNERAIHRMFKICGVSLSLLLIAAPLGIFIGGKVAERKEWLSLEPRGTALIEVLHQRNPDSLVFSPSNFCLPSYVRNPQFGCSKRDLLPFLDAAPRRGGKVPSCLSVGVPAKGKTSLTYHLPSGTTHLKGRLHLKEGGEVSATADGNSIGKAAHSGRLFEIGRAQGQEQVTIVLSAEEQSTVCLELAALQKP
jgi:hypothetical protein